MVADAKAPFMNAGTLYVSFWEICLENLPEASFVLRRITADAAKRFIKTARQKERLLCLSKTDFLAPYHKREHDRQDSLCKVLKQHFGIALTLRDFTMAFDDGDGTYRCINPLNCFQIHSKDQLLVVNCAFGLRDKSVKDRLAFKIEPTTVTFHLLKCKPR